MRRSRTPDQINQSGYITLTEIGRMYGYGYVKCKQIFEKAAQLDTQKLGRNRVFTDMVRIASVRETLGIEEIK